MHQQELSCQCTVLYDVQAWKQLKCTQITRYDYSASGIPLLLSKHRRKKLHGVLS